MKKQDNESLIQEVTKRLDWYIMEASEEEFDADEVQTLMKLLDSLKTEEDNIEDEMPVEEALDDFWKHCEQREAEERLLFGAEEEGENESVVEKEKDKSKDGKFHRILWYFHRHRFAVVTVAVLVVMILGGSWQVVANAEKHGGFFWWMDKSEEGTTMITAPEGNNGDSAKSAVMRYYSIENLPEEYREYVDETFKLETISEYTFEYVQVRKDKHDDNISILVKNGETVIRFQIKRYPQEILRVREKFPGFNFEREFEDEGIVFDVYSKQEVWEQNTYLMYFYYGEEKYVVTGRVEEKELQDIVIEYKNIIVNYYDNE